MAHRIPHYQPWESDLARKNKMEVENALYPVRVRSRCSATIRRPNQLSCSTSSNSAPRRSTPKSMRRTLQESSRSIFTSRQCARSSSAVAAHSHWQRFRLPFDWRRRGTLGQSGARSISFGGGIPEITSSPEAAAIRTHRSAGLEPDFSGQRNVTSAAVALTVQAPVFPAAALPGIDSRAGMLA